MFIYILLEEIGVLLARLLCGSYKAPLCNNMFLESLLAFLLHFICIWIIYRRAQFRCLCLECDSPCGSSPEAFAAGRTNWNHFRRDSCALWRVRDTARYPLWIVHAKKRIHVQKWFQTAELKRDAGFFRYPWV